MPRRWDMSKPPRGRFALNKDSERAQGLVGWWPMGGMTAADLVVDYSADPGSAHMATIATPSLVLGNDCGEPGMSFNGSTQGAATSATPATAWPISMAAWISPAGAPAAQANIFNITNSGSNNPLNLIAIESTLKAVCQGRNDAGTLTASRAIGTTTLSTGALAHIGGTIQSNGTNCVATVWTNGGDKISDSTSIATVMAAVNTTTIGFLRRTTDSNFYNGSVFEVCLWNYLRSDDQMAELADPGRRFELWYPLRSQKWFTVGASGIFSATLTESTTAADAATAALIANAAISEAMAAADATLAAMIAAVSASESVTATDTVAGANVTPVSLSESVTATDAQSAAMTAARAIAEAVTATDVPAATMTAAATVSESASLTDALNGSVGLLTGSVAESVSLADAPSVTFTAAVALAEAVSLIDALIGSANRIYTGAVVEAASASDAWTATVNSGVFVTDLNFLIKMPSGGTTIARARNSWTLT